MKKVAILLVAVACATAAQAGLLKWSFYASASAGASYVGSQVYVLRDDDVIGKTFKETTEITGKAISYNPILSTKVSGQYTTGYKSFDYKLETGTQDFYFFIIASDGKSYYQSASPLTAIIGSTAAQIYYSNDELADSSNWHKFGGEIPEPTSGVLLLLGSAFLALKRKRV